MAAMVPFLRRLSAGPDQVTAGDVLALRCAGLDDKQIMDAVHAAVLLEICNRVVNALGVESMGADQNQRAARFLLRYGYDR
jgi:alkylhydroperoxidase family enzyme